jgi:hypothetical protein
MAIARVPVVQAQLSSGLTACAEGARSLPFTAPLPLTRRGALVWGERSFVVEPQPRILVLLLQDAILRDE